MRTADARALQTKRPGRVLFAALAHALALSACAAVVGAQTVNREVNARSAAVNKPEAARRAPQRFEREGVRVDFSVEALTAEKGRPAPLVAGTDAVATFRVTDANSGQPLTGLRPSAWFSSRLTDRLPSESECKDKIRTFMGGLLSVRADLDLNSYFVLTLNHDNTVSVINPHVAFSRTKLESLIVLPGAGADWVLSKNKEFLYVTLPEQSAVAVVSTVSRKLVNTIPLGEKSRPVRVALDPDERFVWVGLDGAERVAVIDTETNKLVAEVSVGAGQHRVAFTQDARFAYVTNSEANTVTVVNAQTFKKVEDIATGKTPVAVAYSSVGRQMYVASADAEHVSVIDPASRRVVASVPVKRGVVALRFEPGGRYGFAVNQRENTVSVIDAATSAVVAASEVVKGPDQVTFTRNYAYVRGTGSEKFSLIELSTVGKGKLSPVDVQAGQKPPSTMLGEIGVSDMIAPTPEGNAAMIANTPDMMLYFYVEGMMAPMGTFSNYKRRPRALMILDRSLSETAPGVYTVPVRLKKGGRFDVPFMLGQPRVVNCFQLEVAPSPHAEDERGKVAVGVEPLFKGQQFQTGRPARLRFKLSDPLTGRPLEGLDDVRVLIFEPPGVWQERQWAKAAGAGVYEVTQVFPRSGLYNVMVAVSSRGVGFGDIPFTAVPVNDDVKDGADKVGRPKE